MPSTHSKLHWLRPAAVFASGQPGKCVALSGTAVALATCANAAAQHRQPQPDGTLTRLSERHHRPLQRAKPKSARNR
jgi:hypothetical protein